MEHLDYQSVYVKKFDRKIKQYNHSFQLPDYFGPMIGDKKEVRIAELGAALVNTIGDSWPGVKVTVIASDVIQPEYKKLLDMHNVTLHTPIEYQDMESLTYQDESFDIVHCRNAVDHTPDIHKAISEMMRVCKKGGWVYLAHSPSQKTRFGGHHYWNIEEVKLPEGFNTYENKDEGLIISTWQKI